MTFLAKLLLVFLVVAATSAKARVITKEWSNDLSLVFPVTATVGDTIVFTYDGNNHSVEVVSSSDFTSCNTSNPLTSDNSGNTAIILDRIGTWYFICGTPGLCNDGMKLNVQVAAARSTPIPFTSGGGTTTPATSDDGSPPAPPAPPPARAPPPPSPTPPTGAAGGGFGHHVNPFLIGFFMVVAFVV